MENNTKLTETLWDPESIFSSSSDSKYAIIILNQPILLAKKIVFPLWKKAQIRVTVDGGTNQWLKYLGPLVDEVLSGQYLEYAPDLVTGDFDSISPDCMDKLKNTHVKVIETPDQNYTDFTKSLIQLSNECRNKNIKINKIYVFVESSGRLDHIMGYHTIKIPRVLIEDNSWAGLLPVGSSVKNISSTGLKYNLDNHTLAFGDTISSSNTYDGSTQVTVTTHSKIIWSMGIESLVELE
ncbi:thiamine pyrophosphokinase 1 isoform X2 [Cotesia typhae]|uniref:thiamine pyrophosphokinase 1 isoform X2 n=1 Tax=Cotesia typhae TaxID=2053667 RepID=UPI003D69D6C1